MLDVITAADTRAWAILTRAAFATHRREIDELNVFPVPDGDTGTNVYLTVDNALDRVVEEQAAAGILGRATLAEEVEAIAKAMLLSARGNSGVILSQMVRALRDVVVERRLDVLDAAGAVEVYRQAAVLARRAVAKPVEGTILSVADAAAEAARTAHATGDHLHDVVAAAAEGARIALLRTPEQLPKLAAAGVVDAGGAAYVLLLEAMRRVVSGDWDVSTEWAVTGGPDPMWRSGGPGPAASEGVPPGGRAVRAGRSDAAPDGRGSRFGGGLDPLDLPEGQGGAGGPAFEVMYLLSDSDDERVGALRTELARLGDCLLVIGGPDVWNVHVHVDDVGAAIEAGIEAGRPHRIKVTHFAAQVAALEARQPRTGPRTAVVACAAGPGIDAILQDAGALTVPSAPGARASAGALLEAARSSGAPAVLFLPNDKDTVLAAQAAQAAAENEGIEAHVIPARTVVQGLAALAVYDPQASLPRIVVDMTAAAVATRHGGVTIASKEALTSGGFCRPGDALGIVNGDIVIVGDDLAATAEAVLSRLLSAGGELVSIVRGDEAPDALVDGLEAHLHEAWPEVDVVVLDGGQRHYPLLLGVE